MGIDLENLVRVVRSDAELRKKLVCKACFIAALAECAPSVVKSPGKEKRWRREELAAVAAATVARMDGKDQMHCVVGTDEFSANLRYARGSLVYLRADTTPPLRVLLYASLPPASTAPGGGSHEPLPIAPATAAAANAAAAAAAHQENDAGDDDGDDGELSKKQRQGEVVEGAGGKGSSSASTEQKAAAVEAVGAAKLVDACGASTELITAVLEALAEDPPRPPPPPSSSSAKGGDAAAAAEKETAEKAASWRGTRVRDSLTQRYGTFWHVVHDSHAFAGAVHESAPGLKAGTRSLTPPTRLKSRRRRRRRCRLHSSTVCTTSTVVSPLATNVLYIYSPSTPARRVVNSPIWSIGPCIGPLVHSFGPFFRRYRSYKRRLT